MANLSGYTPLECRSYRVTIKRWSAVAALVLTAPVAAQDLPTDQVERHADVVRQDMLLKSTLRDDPARRNDRGRRATPQQATACSNKARFRSEHGPDHPKVRKLYELCRGIGR
ncbi:hypothetical protein [Sphingopyxis chilensis]